MSADVKSAKFSDIVADAKHIDPVAIDNMARRILGRYDELKHVNGQSLPEEARSRLVARVSLKLTVIGFRKAKVDSAVIKDFRELYVAARRTLSRGSSLPQCNC